MSKEKQEKTHAQRASVGKSIDAVKTGSNNESKKKTRSNVTVFIIKSTNHYKIYDDFILFIRRSRLRAAAVAQCASIWYSNGRVIFILSPQDIREPLSLANKRNAWR